MTRKTQRLLNEYVQCHIDLSWCGGDPDDDEDEMKAKLKTARDKFWKHLAALTPVANSLDYLADNNLEFGLNYTNAANLREMAKTVRSI